MSYTRLRGLLCRLTDHQMDWRPPPTCMLCGSDEYWPARATLGGVIERALDAATHRLRAVRLRFGQCPRCGGRSGRHADDCPPF